MKYFTIGSQPGADYSTIAGFYAGTYPAILTDADAPYVGLLQAESHDMGMVVSMDGTDAAHYYILQPLGKYWQGTTDTTGCVIINNTDSVMAFPPFTRIYGCVLKLTGAATYAVAWSLFDGSIYNCLFLDWILSASATKDIQLTIGGNTESTSFYNCVFSGVSLTHSTAGKNIALVYYGKFYNCVITNCVFSGTGTKKIVMPDSMYNFFQNTGYSTDMTYVSSMKNCAFMSGIFTGGTPDSSNFYPYADTTHFAPSGYYSGPNCQLHNSGVYPNLNFGSVNGVDWWPYEWYDVGPLYFNKNTLVLTQNNQSLVFRTK